MTKFAYETEKEIILKKQNVRHQAAVLAVYRSFAFEKYNFTNDAGQLSRIFSETKHDKIVDDFTAVLNEELHAKEHPEPISKESMQRMALDDLTSSIREMFSDARFIKNLEIYFTSKKGYKTLLKFY